LRPFGIEDNSVDIVISNCVINLCDDKTVVLKEIWRVLKPGGELYFSDMYADRRIPMQMKKDKVLWGEGYAGALYVEDFRRIV
jgi:ubiquinone/menaquinone biosynthesis C-methylase UbiE